MLPILLVVDGLSRLPGKEGVLPQSHHVIRSIWTSKRFRKTQGHCFSESR